jgi:hypothetical protein
MWITGVQTSCPGASARQKTRFTPSKTRWILGAMKQINYEELTWAIRLGGRLGLYVLVPLSILLIVVSLFGTIAGIDAETASRWVRFGLEAFLMGGWSFGAVSLVRQAVARVLIDAVAVFASTATGILVIHLMAVIFAAISADAPQLLVADGTGGLVSFAVAVSLSRRTRDA